MSPKYEAPSFFTQCIYDKEDQENDDCHGYHRLENTDRNSSVTDNIQSTNIHGRTLHSTNSNSYQPPESRTRSGKKSDVYTKVDAKGKRLSSKLRHKEIRKRVGHALHSTWKWMKRGAIAAAPSMASMFMFSPAFTFATTQQRRS